MRGGGTPCRRNCCCSVLAADQGVGFGRQGQEELWWVTGSTITAVRGDGTRRSCCQVARADGRVVDAWARVLVAFLLLFFFSFKLYNCSCPRRTRVSKIGRTVEVSECAGGGFSSGLLICKLLVRTLCVLTSLVVFPC